MGAAAEQMRGTAERIGRLALALPEWRLPVGEMGAEAFREYVDFRLALNRCRTSANDEFAYIRERMAEVETMGGEVAAMSFPPFRDDCGSLAVDEQERQRKIHVQAENQFKAFKEAFTREFGELQGELERTARESVDFKMVLFGKTQVGKSTIREALTRGNGATIGRGYSSTTKECHEYTWRTLHVWDTPGINSIKDTNVENGVGDEERAALEKLESADIAVFVFKTEPFAIKERAMLKRIVESGRPYLLLMNVVADFTDYSKFKKRRKDRQISREAQREAIDDLLGPFPEAEKHLIPIHARACYFSRARGAPEVDAFFEKWKVGRQEVYALSNFGEFRARLTAFILGQGTAARRQTIDRVFAEKTEAFFGAQKRALGRLLGQLDEIHKDLDNARRALRRMSEEWKGSAFAERMAAEFREGLAPDGVDGLARIFIESNLDEDEIKARWDERMERIGKEAAQALELAFHAELERIISNLKFALQRNDLVSERIGEAEDNAFDWGNALKWGGRVVECAGAGLLIFLGLSNPIGWIVEAVGFIAKWFSKRFGKDRKIRKLQEQLSDNLSQNRDLLCGKVGQELRGTLDKVDADLRRLAVDNEELRERLGAIAGVCCRAEGLVAKVRKRIEGHGHTFHNGERK